MSFKACAPGSLMLLGEYAVLYGKNALVCAVDKRMSVVVTPREDNKITIVSALGELHTDLAHLKIEAPFQFVLATLKKFHKKMHVGCDIKIESQFSHAVGFASSAAVTVATCAALAAWLKISLPALELVKVARSIVRDVQGLGSGADVAACVFGGIVAYRAQPYTVEKLAHSYPLTVVYSGNKTPTVDAIAYVKKYFANSPKLFQQICHAIDSCAVQGRQAVFRQNWAELGKIMNIQQGLMDALGVNTLMLNEIATDLRKQPNMLGAKISGSGLGDCVIGLGDASNVVASSSMAQHIPVAITDVGVMCEEI